MAMPDDEKFEKYLRQFKPIVPDPLPVARRQPALRRLWLYAITGAAAAALLVALVFTMRGHPKPVISPQALNPAGSTGGEELAIAQPLTLRRANDLLLHAPSFSAALNNVAFHRQRRKLPQGSLSALAVLSKEDIKL